MAATSPPPQARAHPRVLSTLRCTQSSFANDTFKDTTWADNDTVNCRHKKIEKDKKEEPKQHLPNAKEHQHPALNRHHPLARQHR
jgi:hypothetical protein